MPRTKEQNEAIREEKMALIEKAALKLFAEKGFHSVSIAMIAKEAGISKGLLYHYIENKEDLLKQIFRKTLKKSFSYLDEIKGDISTGEVFELFVRRSFDSIKKQRTFYKLLLTIYISNDLNDIVSEEMGKVAYFDVLYKYFEKHYDDPEKQFAIYSTMHEGTIFMYCMDTDNYGVKAMDYMIEEIIKRFKK